MRRGKEGCRLLKTSLQKLRRLQRRGSGRRSSGCTGTNGSVGGRPASGTTGRNATRASSMTSRHDEQAAARAVDKAARRLRPKGEAHGLLAGTQWLRLNFPTAKEKAYANGKGMPPQKKAKAR